MQQTKNEFGVSDAINVLTAIACSPDEMDAYTQAGEGIALLYSSKEIDGYFENTGTCDFEATMDEVRVLTSPVHQDQGKTVLITAKQLAFDVMNEIFQDISRAASADTPYKEIS